MKKLLLSIMTQMAMQMSMQVAMPLSASAQQLLPYQNANLSAEERAIGGLGIFMVKKSMDDMFYEYKDSQNVLTIVKKLN